MERPSRSDARLPPEQEAARAAEAREHYDDLAPRRHPKPPRSEPSSDAGAAGLPSGHGSATPEVDKLRELELHAEELVVDGGAAEEEYVETEYYEDMNCVGKQHHTTGTGFIKVEEGEAFKLSQQEVEALEHHASSHGNPATNEWLPSLQHTAPHCSSDKPSRSDA